MKDREEDTDVMDLLGEAIVAGEVTGEHLEVLTRALNEIMELRRQVHDRSLDAATRGDAATSAKDILHRVKTTCWDIKRSARDRDDPISVGLVSAASRVLAVIYEDER